MRAVVREAKHFLPRIEGAIVKTASSRNNVKCLPLDKSRSALEKAAAHSLENLKKFEPSKLASPIHLDVVLSSPELVSMAVVVPRSRSVDDRIISYVAQDYGEAIDAFATIFFLVDYKWSACFGQAGSRKNRRSQEKCGTTFQGIVRSMDDGTTSISI